MPHVAFLGGNNVVMRGTESEDRQFVFCPDEDVPLVLDIVGVTPPTPKYYISRKCCDHYVLFYVSQGSGTLDYNGTHYDLHAHDTVLLAPGSCHCYAAAPNDPFKIIWINFFCDWLPAVLAGLGLDDKPVVSGVSCEEKLLELFRLARTTPNNNQLCFSALCTINEILLSLAEHVQFENHAKSESALARKIKDMLDESIYGKVDMGTIAERLYISKSSVYRQFEKYYGCTPYHYILNRKVERAKSLLCRTNYTVADIAQRLSFSDEFYFSNLFKRKVGLSPTAYRRQFASPGGNTVYPPPL